MSINFDMLKKFFKNGDKLFNLKKDKEEKVEISEEVKTTKPVSKKVTKSTKTSPKKSTKKEKK